jgi:hypothetical protein
MIGVPLESWGRTDVIPVRRDQVGEVDGSSAFAATRRALVHLAEGSRFAAAAFYRLFDLIEGAALGPVLDDQPRGDWAQA